MDIEEIVLYDAFIPNNAPYILDLQTDSRVKTVSGDISDKTSVESVISLGGFSHLSVFHLASILSGPGERNFDLCLKVNMDGTRNILEAMRAIFVKTNVPQKIIFTSTNAVFGPTDIITDDTPLLPQTTYGTTKIICEKLINDYTRKGFIVGAGVRLPSVLIRPEPNTAASNCFNAVMREPLKGIDYKCSVPLTTRHPITSKKNVINCLIKIHEIDNRLLGIDKILLVPARSYTLLEMYEAAKVLAKRNGIEKFGSLSEEIKDEDYQIVKFWPPEVNYARAKSLDFPEEIDIEDIIPEFIDEFILNK
jgi:nucleoside-diphosphate-sugar epimerase